MQQVDIILRSGTVVTMNTVFDVFHDGAVAIRGAQIVAVGSTESILARYSAPEIVDCSRHVIMPGLVNAHTHVPMTLLRGLADDLRLDVWLMGYIMPTEREFVSPEFCQLGTGIACAEMIRGGVTTFADMYYFEGDIAEATAAAGMRAVLGQTILKFPAPDAESYDESLANTRRFIEQWRGHPLITPAVAPHAPYSNTDITLQKCTELALEFGVPLLTHIAETRQEVDDSLEIYGKSVVPWVKDVGLLEAPVLAAHCVHIDEFEMRTLAKHNAAVAHCPSANLKLASGIAKIQQMLEHGITVALGTDGPASNNDLDMFEEMRLAAFLAKVATEDPTALPARQALYMATRAGAKALQLEDKIGSLEPGKLADITILNAEPVHNMPHFDANSDAVYSRIVYAGKANDVSHVLVNGAWLMKERQLLTLDEPALLEQARVYAAEVGTFVTAREGDVLSKLVAVSNDVERSESFEVQMKAVLRDESIVDKLLTLPNLQITREVHYRQYDTYFIFPDPQMGRVRYREDDRLDEKGSVQSVRTRLTYTMPTKEREFHSTILLSHSRFIAPADRPLRFYREYFQASEVRELQKDRRRWRVEYFDVLFFVNVDRVLKPELTQPNTFIEIKSRTWSARDAENKADMIRELIRMIGIEETDIIHTDYLEMETLAD